MNRNFKGVWIPKEIWENEELTIMEKIFLVEIDSLDNEQGCFASNSYFADFFKLSNSRASQIINSLAKKEYIDIVYERDPNTQEILKRVVNTRIKYIKGGIKYSKGGYLENAKDNSTIINNTNNINNSGETSSPTTPSRKTKKTSKLFSAPKDTSKKDLAWYNQRAELLESFSFEDKVEDAILEFLESLIQMKALLPEMALKTQFERLSNVQGASTQIKIVKDTISRGWKSLDYMINDVNKSKTSTFDTAKNSENQFYTEEQKSKMREAYRNASEEDIF